MDSKIYFDCVAAFHWAKKHYSRLGSATVVNLEENGFSEDEVVLFLMCDLLRRKYGWTYRQTHDVAIRPFALLCKEVRRGFK